MSSFGVIICTCRFDFFLAKACVASVRRSMGDVPITLFMDDDVNATALAKLYNLNLMYRSQLQDEFLRNHNRGWGLPKISLFWVSPYERFLYLDCDTIVWGDVAKAYLHGDWDMVVDPGDSVTRPWVQGVATEAWTNKEYFNSQLMEETFPQFPWRKYIPSYFCTGCYAARRGAFSLDEYKSLVATMKQTPKLFPIGEMGFLNYMVFNAVEQGWLRLAQRPLQLMCDYTNMQSLPERFEFNPNGPVVKPGDEKILHFTDPKPVTSSYGFHSPFDYFRKDVARQLSLLGRIWPGLYIRVEELEFRLTKWWRRSRLKRFHYFVRPLLFWKKANG